ncbi:MAG: Hydrolase, alpha/beta fold family [uncultured Gemmatimonadetes bacterium]|uniref:Hydrolase, alpha/beta fold family n=1 Tax=uncultured Gemmatimonadota bacterium TaxID=203437 RepID=A0A6J4MMM3_9BACT|nr:MAG: Hydrolase, alpha/beta fold family [uncultured Gemmatimonadota bacterium]
MRGLSFCAPSAAAVVIVTGLAGCARAAHHPRTTATGHSRVDAVVGRYAAVNGLRMYYEVHGQARGTKLPLVLLHGGGSTIGTTFGRVLPAFAASRQVIAVELQGHGHTADRDGALSFAQDADDVAALLREIGVPAADVLGFSNGANTALELGRRHPDRVGRLVAAAGFLKKDGIPAPVWEFFRQPPDPGKMPPALREAYLQAAHDPARLPELVAKLMQRLNSFRDWTDDEVRSIRAPTLLMVGDADVVTVEHTVQMSRLLPRAQLAVFPGAVHGAYIGEATAAPCAECITSAVGLIVRFLDSPSAPR